MSVILFCLGYYALGIAFVTLLVALDFPFALYDDDDGMWVKGVFVLVWPVALALMSMAVLMILPHYLIQTVLGRKK